MVVCICLTGVRTASVFSSRNSWQEDDKAYFPKCGTISLRLQYAYGTVVTILKRVSLAFERWFFSWVFSILLDLLATYEVFCAD